ncbi:MAG: Uma2 family endonuclease [Acidobacteriota bacterium]|nr:Uma2 family endonuclease [Acidobacteriota bacterium]
MISTNTEATIDDLYRVPGKQKAEIVNGEVVTMSPTGKKPNRAGFKICLRLYEHELRTGGGIAVTDNAGFSVNLPHRKAFSPDAAFYVGNDTGMKFFEGAPVFAAKVRSEYDYGAAAEREIRGKIADYFATGALVVWDVDLLGEDVIRVYRRDAADNPTIYRRGDMAEAEPAVPGWSMAVDDLFQ